MENVFANLANSNITNVKLNWNTRGTVLCFIFDCKPVNKYLSLVNLPVFFVSTSFLWYRWPVLFDMPVVEGFLWKISTRSSNTTLRSVSDDRSTFVCYIFVEILVGCITVHFTKLALPIPMLWNYSFSCLFL